MKNFGLLGHKISYSLSPFLHNEINSIKNINTNYPIYDTSTTALLDILPELQSNTSGFNVTTPYKTEIIAHLDNLDSSAILVGAVNTVKNVNGVLSGYNTDVLGLKWALCKTGIDFSDKNVLILGCGGAARAAFFTLKSIGVLGVFVSARDLRAEQEFCLQTGAISFNAQPYYEKIDVIINATPVGTSGKSDVFHVKLDNFTSLCFCYDMVYNPRITALCKHMNALGVPCESGLSMLVAQGAFASEIWNGTTFSNDEIDTLLCRLSAHMALENNDKNCIALCGFMAAGKTTVGKYLAQLLGFDFFDTDTEIEHQFAMSISNIFSTYGESTFRSAERDISSTIPQKNKCVISLGGGFIFDRQALLSVRKNCLLVFLDTPFELICSRLAPDLTRPLLDSSDISALYNARLEYYKKNAHMIFKPQGISACSDANTLAKSI